MQINKNSESEEYLRMPQLLKMLPISKATIWRKVRLGEFPQPIKLGYRISMWKKSEIIDFLNANKI